VNYNPASLTLRLLTMPGLTARLGLEQVLTFAGIRSRAPRSGHKPRGAGWLLPAT
jgi:hypothetical protein